MSKQVSKISVKALQAYTRDVGKNIARIDPKLMDTLGVSVGNALEILGEYRTVSKCMPLYKSDFDKVIMRIDGLIRENAGLEIGDSTEIRKVEPVLAEKISVAAIKGKFDIDPEYIVESLSGMPVILGDKVLIHFGLESKPLVVLDARPRADVYLIGDRTSAELLPSIT